LEKGNRVGERERKREREREREKGGEISFRNNFK